MSSDDGQEPKSYSFILDPSALAYGGVGKIKQWVDLHTADQPTITFYVPNYTLRELDFLKKVFNPLISMNARESIRFIDSQISNDNEDVLGIDDDCENRDDDYGDFESFNARKNQNLRNEKKKNNIQFILESSTDSGPDWRKASGFRRYTPSISELPKPINGKSSHGLISKNGKGTVGVFGNNIPGSFKSVTNSDDFFENQSSHPIYDSKNMKVDDKAVIPRRLKFLIRSCIQKQYIENKEMDNKEINWIVICEDPTTCIWLKCFGLAIMTLNDVETIFEEFSGTHNNVLYDPNSGSLVQTTKNDYKRERYGPGRGKGRGSFNGKGRSKGCKQNNIKKGDLKKSGETGLEVKAKCRSADEYAPRASGELWTG